MKIKNVYSILILIVLLTATSCNNKPTIQLDVENLKNSTDSLKFFKIYNKGAGSLIIEDFTTSCECTTLDLQKNRKIKAGDSLIVNLKINKQALDNDNTIYITIKTNAKPRLTSFYFKS